MSLLPTPEWRLTAEQRELVYEPSEVQSKATLFRGYVRLVIDSRRPARDGRNNGWLNCSLITCVTIIDWKIGWAD